MSGNCTCDMQPNVTVVFNVPICNLPRECNVRLIIFTACILNFVSCSCASLGSGSGSRSDGRPNTAEAEPVHRWHSLLFHHLLHVCSHDHCRPRHTLHLPSGVWGCTCVSGNLLHFGNFTDHIQHVLQAFLS